MRLHRPKVALAGARFVATLTALLVPWPGLASRLVSVYVQVANLWLFCLRAGANVRVFGGALRAAPWTAQVAFRSTIGPVDVANLDAWRTFHLPASVFLALCLARLPRRRWHALPVAGLGLLLLVGLPLPTVLEHAARLGLVSLPGPALALLIAVDRALWAPAGMAFLVPAATWLVLIWSANCITARQDAAMTS
jgi:hypothetical protein